jgi:hypothetical protein
MADDLHGAGKPLGQLMGNTNKSEKSMLVDATPHSLTDFGLNEVVGAGS